MFDAIHNDDVGKLIVRLTTGILMLFHGISKIMNPGTMDWIVQLLGNVGLPAFMSYGVYIGEIVAAAMIILGVFTRLGGLLIVINMLFALFLVHTDEFLQLGEHGQWAIEVQMFYLMFGLAIVFLGSGKYAIKTDSY